MRYGWSLAVQPDCLKGRVVCGTVYGDMHLKDLLGSITSRVLYPGPGFLSSATWPSLPKKHYNGLINQVAYVIATLWSGVTFKEFPVSEYGGLILLQTLIVRKKNIIKIKMLPYYLWSFQSLSTRTEISADFHRLNVLLMRAVGKDLDHGARKVATATLSGAKIQATMGEWFVYPI